MDTARSLNEKIRWITIVLLSLSRSPNRSMSEAELIMLIERSTWVTQSERLSVSSRTDSRIANRIHNLVSHRDSRTNPIRLKLIAWDRYASTFSWTERSADFLRKVSQKLGVSDQNNFRLIENWLTKIAVKRNKGSTE